MKKDKKVATEVLVNALESIDSYDQFLDQNKENLGIDPFKVALRKMMGVCMLDISEIIDRAQVDRTYGYQLFNGTRKPSRDKIIQLCLGMELNLKESNYLLKCAQKSPLYAKSERDSAIIYGISHAMTVDQVNELLAQYGLQLL